MKRTMVYALALGIAATVTLTACSWFGDSDSGGGDVGLRRALGRIASTEQTRARITYGDTSGIVKLAGRDWAKQKGFAVLRTAGAEQVASFGQQGMTDTGIVLLDADYAVTAGEGPQTVGVIAGGQEGDKVSSALTKLGWKRDGTRLTAPEINVAATGPGGQYALILGQVRSTGKDVTYGQPKAGLDRAGAPSGKTLAEDTRVKALVDCLGDVVAAQFAAMSGSDKPGMIAMGVRRPKNDGEVPHGVVCTTWSSPDAATTYAGNLDKAVKTEQSNTGVAFAELLKAAKIQKVGGRQNVVRWQADTPNNPQQVFQMLARGDMPGLPS